MTHGVSVEIREQPVSPSSLLPPYGFQGLNQVVRLGTKHSYLLSHLNSPAPPILLFSFLLLFLESGSPVAQADLRLVAEDDLAS